MKYIQLSNNKQARVDDADYDMLNQHKWSFDGQYAHRMAGNVKVYMHRQVMGYPKGLQIDHEDLDKLNCQRHNLRVGTHSQNTMNKGLQSNNTSGYKGVSWYKAYQKWESKIKKDGKSIKLGYFDNIKDAAQAYNQAALIHHGKFARLNDV